MFLLRFASQGQRWRHFITIMLALCACKYLAHTEHFFKSSFNERRENGKLTLLLPYCRRSAPMPISTCLLQTATAAKSLFFPLTAN